MPDFDIQPGDDINDIGKEVVGTFDPTPVGLGIAIGEGLGDIVDPFVEDARKKRQEGLEYWLSTD